MNSRAILFLVLIGLLAVAAAVVFGGDPAVEEPGNTDVGQGTSRTRPADLVSKSPKGSIPQTNRQRVDASFVAGADEPEAYRRALSGLRGRLIWERSREPLVGVEVKVIEVWLDAIVPSLEDFVGVERMRSPVVFRSKTTTDADGVFELRGIHGRALMVLAIGLKTEVAAIRPVPRNPGPGELVDMGDIEILERGTVTGRIVDETGKGVVGARVRIADLPAVALQFGIEQFDPEGMALVAQGPYRVVLELPPWLKDYDEFLPFGDGRTDREGRFKILGVRPGNPTILVSKQKMAPTTRSIAVMAEIEQDIGSITIGEGEYVTGRFVDTDGEPVAGIRVTAGGVMALLPGGLLKKPIVVGVDGKFDIPGLPRGVLYLCYQREPRQPWEVSGPHRGDDEIKIVLGALRSGTVRLQPKGGGPVHGVRFDLFIADVASYLPGFETHVSGDGHFFRDQDRPDTWHVRELPTGIYKIIVKAPGFAFGTGVLDLSKKTPEGRTEVIELFPAPETRFEVRDGAGQPVHAARVYWNASPGRAVEKSRRRRLTKLPILLGKTGADGVLIVDSLEVGAHRFYCRHPAFALGVSDQRVVPGRPIHFVLGQAGSLVGEVAENGRPPKGVRTVLAEPDGQLRRRFAGVLMPRMATTLPDGTFSFASIQPGKWRIRAVKDVGSLKTPLDFRRIRESRGGNSPRADVEIRVGEESFVFLEIRPVGLDAGGSIVGSVRVGGKPAKGAWVQTWAGRRRTQVADNGTFELLGLQDGDLWIGVERPGHEGLLPNRLWEGRVLIEGGAQAVLHVDVQVADVTIEVVDLRGRPAEGLPLELLGVARKTGEHAGRVRMAVATDGSGIARFVDVPAGDYFVRSMMQRNPVLTVPEVPLQVFSGRAVTKRLTAAAPAVVGGAVQWDESELRDDLEREYARARRPTYLVFESTGRYTWGAVTSKDGQDRFTLRKAAPGTYRLSSRGKLRWTSTPLVIDPGGSRDAVVRLRPDVAQVRAEVDKLRPKEEPKKKESKPGGDKKK